MSRDRERPPLDREVVELLGEEPELLAIADALSATHPRAQVRRFPLRSSAAAAAAVVLVLVVVAVALVTSSNPNLVDRALAVVGDRPLVRAELERTLPNDRVVDLRTGKSESSTVSVTAFADDSTGLLRVRVVHNGVPVSDDSAPSGVPAAAAGVDRLLATFVRTYRPALRDRTVTVRSGVDGGALRLRRFGITVDVAANGKPFNIRGDGDWRVVTVSSTLNRGHLLTPARRPSVVRGDVVARSPLPFSAVPRSLGGEGRLPALVGISSRRAFSEQLRSITALRVSSRSAGLRLEYGRGRKSLVILEALAPEAAYGFAEGRYTFDFDPVPRGALDLHGGGQGPWLGQMKVGRLFVTLRSSDRAVVLAAARSLVG